jgi:exopolysaccharide biosynthesis polyprenyl glycosylphosphotransferase
MNRKKLDGVKHMIRSIEGVFEIAILALSYYLVWRHIYDEGVFPAYYGYGKYVLAGVYALLTLVLFRNFDGFKFGYMKLTDVIISQCIAMVLGNFITFWQLCLIANQMISPVPILLLTLIDTAVIFACCYVYTVIYHHLYVPKNMVMVYGTEDALTLKFKMDTRMDKYRVNKLIPAEAGLKTICKTIVDYDAVIIVDVRAELRNDILKFCYQNGIRTYLSPKITDIIMRGATKITLFDTPLMLIRSKGLTLSQRTFKRLFDILLSLLAMVVAAPIMLITALAIKIEDGGPVFYKQKRVTINGKVFEILKFRSMIVDAEKDGNTRPAVDRDPRITRVGNVIRAIRVDELPQILNILKGDMSIVGPRPERVENVQEYTKDFPEFAFRLKVKGGLTGYAQIYGKYNTSAYDKLRLDMEYIENYSLMLDIKLVLTTLRILMSKESTEGFDKREELERRKKELLEKEAAGSGREE